MRTMTFEAADAALDGALSASFQGDYERVLVVEGDLELEGDLLESIARKAPAGEDFDIIAITGNLTVKGRVASYDYTPGLYVGGYTLGDTLEGGDCEIYVGDATINYFVYGYYNDGILETGKVTVPYVINSNHDLRVSAKKAIWIDNYGDDDDCSFGSSNIAESFVSEVLSKDDESEIEVDAFLERLRNGKPVLREGAMTAEQAAHAEIDQAIDTRATRLSLRERKLKSFPMRICEMTWLRVLDLGKNAIGEIPKEIAALSELEELRIDGCGLGKLPVEIGALGNLRVLSVASNSVYDFAKKPSRQPISLPDELGELVSLEELNVSSLSAKLDTIDGDVLPPMSEYRLPNSVSLLARLRTLIADQTNIVFPKSMHGLASLTSLSLVGHSWAYLKALPQAVTTFSNLTFLDLRGNFFDELPSSLASLENLETLRLSGSLGRLRTPVPDLSALSKLRVLHFNGSSGHTGVREPKQDVLAQLFAMNLPGLKELSIDRWGAEKDYRAKLDAAIIAEIGRFAALEKLDLSFNGLAELPEGFFELKNLRTIDLRYNGLHKPVRQRIAKENPQAQIDLRNQRFPKGEEEKSEARTLNSLVKKANAQRSAKNYAAAIANYDRALESIASGDVVSAYDQLYCHYGKAWIYSQLGFVDTSRSDEARAASREDGVESSKEAIALVPTFIWQFTDEGQFHREVLRFCGNFVAWQLKEEATFKDDPKLAEALALIERAVECVESAQHHYVIDTQVRILLAMKRTTDAFVAARSVLGGNPSFADLADIQADTAYQAWLTSGDRS